MSHATKRRAGGGGGAETVLNLGRRLQRHILPVTLSLFIVILLYLHVNPSLSPLPSIYNHRSYSSSSSGCHPYHAYGHLAVSRDVPEHNRWHPFDASCQAPELFRAFRKKLGKESEEVKKVEREGESWMGKMVGGGQGEDVEFARGKTVLMIGDSTVREQLIQFCELAGETFTILNAPYPPPPAHVPSNSSAHHHAKRAGKDASLPHTCYVPKLDFLVVSVFHFGVDQESFWRDKDQFNPPSTFEDRIDEIALPLAHNLENLLPATVFNSTSPKPSSQLRRTVDLIECSTGLWDLARFAKIDIEAGRSTITDLDRSQLTYFRKRVSSMVSKLRRSFPPSTKIVWRSTHYPSDQAKIDWFMGWNYDDPSAHRPFFHQNRLYQLDQAARSAILPDGTSPGIEGVEYSEWGQMLLGQHVHQKDQLHPGPLPAGFLGSDMMLYELREAVLSRVALE